MIAASRLAEVDRELEAFGVDDAKVEAVLKAVRALSLSAEDIEAFLSGAADVDIAFERPSSEAIAVEFEESAPEAAVQASAPEESVDATGESDALASEGLALAEAAAPSQEIELDVEMSAPVAPVIASAGLPEGALDSDFPVEGTELVRPGRELELDFEGDLSVGAEPLQFESPTTETHPTPSLPSVRPSRAPLSQADLDAEFAAILADPEDHVSDAGEPGRVSMIDVDVEMSADADVEVSEDSSDAVDVTDVAEVADVTAEDAEASSDFPESAPIQSTRPPPLPTRPPSMAPGAPESGPGFLGRLLNRK